MRNVGFTAAVAGEDGRSADWRRSLRRSIVCLLALKLVALLLMRALLFPSDRSPDVDASLVSRQLGLVPTAATPRRGAEHD